MNYADDVLPAVAVARHFERKGDRRQAADTWGSVSAMCSELGMSGLARRAADYERANLAMCRPTAPVNVSALVD